MRLRGIWRLRSRLLALIITFGALLGAGEPATLRGPAIELNAILSLTGGGAFLGTDEQRAMRIAEGLVNPTGGIGGRPVKFVFADDQSNPQVALQLTSTLAANHVPVIFGPSLSATCLATVPIVQDVGPVSYCFSPVVRGQPESYVFSAGLSTSAYASSIARFFRDKGWIKIGLITSNDSTGQDFEREFTRVLSLHQNSAVRLVAREHFAPTDLTVAAQMANIKAAQPQALMTYTTGSPLATLLRGIKDAGLDIPVAASAGNMNVQQIVQYRTTVPDQLFFPGTRGVGRDALLRAGPIKDAQSQFFTAFRNAGIQPDIAAVIVWDPVMIVVDAMRHLGPDTSAAKLRDFMLQFHSWAGVAGMYDFRDGSQRGIDANAVVVYRWDAAASTFIVVSRPGGSLK